MYRETGRKDTRGGRTKREGGKVKRGRRRGAGEWISLPPVHPLCYGSVFAANS